MDKAFLVFVEDVSYNQVPSAYFLTDCFLYVDKILSSKQGSSGLYKPQGIDTRLDLAAKDGVKAKRCIGSLRYLWRSSEGSYDPRLVDLKAALRPSPHRGQRRAEPVPLLCAKTFCKYGRFSARCGLSFIFQHVLIMFDLLIDALRFGILHRSPCLQLQLQKERQMQ